MGVTVGCRPRKMRVFRRDNAPPFVQLALSGGQLVPHIQQNESTMLGGAIEPGTHGIVINLDDPCGRPDRMAFREGAND